MKVRYCQTPLEKWRVCQVGWGSWSSREKKSCMDEPMEEKCNMIVDTDCLRCPCCGGLINMDGKKEGMR